MTKKFSQNWLDWNYEKKKKKLTETLELTLTLFKKGDSIEEIAKKRNYKLETVEYQIIELIAMSFVNISNILNQNAIDEIENTIETKKPKNLKDLREELNDKYNYFELKCYLAYLNQMP